MKVKVKETHESPVTIPTPLKPTDVKKVQPTLTWMLSAASKYPFHSVRASAITRSIARYIIDPLMDELLEQLVIWIFFFFFFVFSIHLLTKMFTFVWVLFLLVEKTKQAKDYSVNSLQTNAEVNQAIYHGIIAICFLYIAIYHNTLLVYRDSPIRYCVNCILS